jgi:hypothetical protein
MTGPLPPWRRTRPMKPIEKMTDEQIERARERARLAGRRYPNLVDNMAVLAADRAGRR